MSDTKWRILSRWLAPRDHLGPPSIAVMALSTLLIASRSEGDTRVYLAGVAIGTICVGIGNTAVYVISVWSDTHERR